MRKSRLEFLPWLVLGAGFLIAAPVAGGQTPGCSTPAPASTEPHYPTNEDLRHIKTLSQPQLSPDGKLVLFTVTESTADGAASHLWVVPIAGGEKPRQLTYSPSTDKSGEHAAQWSPDGAAIYFTARRGEHTQLFRLDMRGGDAAPYDLKVLPAVDESKARNAIPPPGAEKKDSTTGGSKDGESAGKSDASPEPLAIDVGGFAPSPDGKWLAVWARDPETPGEKKQKDAKADAVPVNESQHLTRLYLAALAQDGSIDGSLKPVAADPDVRGVYWSPDSGRFLVLAEKPNGESDLGPAGAMWMVEVSAPGKATRLTGVPATVSAGAAWKPDGSEIVFSAQTPEDAPPGYEELFALPVGAESTSGASPRRLSAGFKGQLYGGAMYYTNDDGLVAEAGIGFSIAPVRLALDGSKPPHPLRLGSALVGGLNTNRRQTGWVWLAESGGEPAKMCFAEHLGDACIAVPTPALAPEHLRAVKPELVRWKNGGFEIEGLLYLPEIPAGTKAPLIVDVHGGPFGAFTDRNDRFVAFLVGHGWAVLLPNPRGSSNYGVKFAAANKNDLGDGDYQDIMAGVDAVLARYPIDAGRMALFGYSYGGEMAAFVEGKTDRFKAIVSGAPVIDQFSEYGTEDDSWYDRWYYGKPWEHFEDAWRQSPLSGAGRAKTPFLLLQGESDTVDPPGQSEEMYRALRQEGVPAELVTYPRENHGPLAAGLLGLPSPEPWHGYDARQRVVEFIEKNFGQPNGQPQATEGKP
jgi:dipeptidyl aminopeptidase/acylaminoacyl peptidase